MTKTPAYEEFSFTADVAAETIDRLIVDREVFYAPTGASSTHEAQHLAVYRTMPHELTGTEPIVRMPAWSDDNGRPEGALFDAYLAAATGRPVLAPNAPGVDFSRWRDPRFETAHHITPDQREELLRHGSFAKVGAAVMQAVDKAAEHFDMARHPIIHASSMGVAMAGAAIREALWSGITVRGVVLAEGVNMAERHPLKLGIQFIGQNRYAAGYLAQNPDKLQKAGEAMTFWMRRTREAWHANFPYVRGLARAAFLSDLGDVSGLGTNEQQTSVFMSRGTASRLSDVGGYHDVLAYLKQHGVAAEGREFEGHDHPYTLTVQSVVDGVRQVA